MIRRLLDSVSLALLFALAIMALLDWAEPRPQLPLVEPGPRAPLVRAAIPQGDLGPPQDQPLQTCRPVAPATQGPAIDLDDHEQEIV